MFLSLNSKEDKFEESQSNNGYLSSRSRVAKRHLFVLGNLTSRRDIECISLEKHIYEWWETERRKEKAAKETEIMDVFSCIKQPEKELASSTFYRIKRSLHKYDSWHLVVVCGQAIYSTCFEICLTTTSKFLCHNRMSLHTSYVRIYAGISLFLIVDFKCIEIYILWYKLSVQ